MESILVIINSFKELNSSTYDDYINKFHELTDDLDLTIFNEVMSVFLIKHSKNLVLIETHLMKTEVYKSDLLVSYINILIPHLLYKNTYTFTDNLHAIELLKSIIEYSKLTNNEIVVNGFLISSYYLLYRISICLADFNQVWKKLLFIIIQKSENIKTTCQNSEYLRSITLVIVNSLFKSKLKVLKNSREYNIILRELSNMNI